MANYNNANGLHVLNAEKYVLNKYFVNAAYAFGPTDVVYGPESAGYATDTAGSLGIGIQGSEIMDGATGVVNAASGTAGDDYILAYDDPNLEFWAQMTTGAAADVYTTATETNAFDVAGTTGVMYIDAGASTQDTARVIRNYVEPDTGEPSAVGAYQKKVFMFTSVWHYRKDS